MSGATVDCRRCGRTERALDRAPLPGKLGEEIRTSVCALCWAEWQRVEVMVINELKLNFMDPASQEILAAETRRFFGLDGRPPGDEPDKNPDPR